MASGITSLIKTVLSLTNRVFYPTLNFQRANPQLGLEHARLKGVPFNAWPEGTTPRTAGVSAFGLGGTNAHLVVQAPLSTPQARAQQMGPCRCTRQNHNARNRCKTPCWRNWPHIQRYARTWLTPCVTGVSPPRYVSVSSQRIAPSQPDNSATHRWWRQPRVADLLEIGAPFRCCTETLSDWLACSEVLSQAVGQLLEHFPLEPACLQILPCATDVYQPVCADRVD